MTKPTTDTDWTIHSINIHGEYFEEWCQETIRSTGGWGVDMIEYPVEFPSPYSKRVPKEGALDMRANFQNNNNQYSLLIECKKNNKDFVNWVFFPKRPKLVGGSQQLALASSYFERGHNRNNFSISQHRITSSLPLAYKARETRQTYKDFSDGNKTKTSNEAVMSACHQITLATQSVLLEIAEKGYGFQSHLEELKTGNHILLPVIITSARLYMSEFEPEHIDPQTGEIPFDKVTLTECNKLFFEYSVPKHLQDLIAHMVSLSGRVSLPPTIRMNILIVNSAHFPDLLTEIKSKGTLAF